MTQTDTPIQRASTWTKNILLLFCLLTPALGGLAFAQTPPERCKPVQTPDQWTKPSNQSSPCYEVHQSFDGGSFLKDNNIWTYTKDFADLFGMPARHIEGLRGAEAAAFRIRDRGYQLCGMGGNVNACLQLEACIVELYFDESKTKLPWATNRQTEWVPSETSFRWLRDQAPPGQRKNFLNIEPPEGIVRLQPQRRSGNLVVFADPVTRLEAIFTSNVSTDKGGDFESSGNLIIDGYVRRFYRDMSMVSLQLGCFISSRKTIAIRLELQENHHQVTKRYQTIVLPEGFVTRIHALYKAIQERDSQVNKSLFAPPLGTKGTTAPNSSTTTP